MKHLASTVVPHREKPAYKLGILLGRTPLYSRPTRRQALITKIAGILTAIVVFASVPDTILSSKFALDATKQSDFAEPSAAHVVVNGLHIAIANNLAHIAIEQLMPLP